MISRPGERVSAVVGKRFSRLLGERGVIVTNDGCVDPLYTIRHLPRPRDYQASYTSCTFSPDSLLPHPPPLPALLAPPFSSQDISVANDLRRQGQRQPYQTPPAVEQIPLRTKKGSPKWISFFPCYSFYTFSAFTFYLISNHLLYTWLLKIDDMTKYHT